MNKADEIKGLATAYAEARIQYENNGETPRDYEAMNAAGAAIYAATDAQQAEIGRLRSALQHEVDCLEAAKAEIKRLKEWQEKAFQAHPDIDMGLEFQARGDKT
jgi:hypothetical protein